MTHMAPATICLLVGGIIAALLPGVIGPLIGLVIVLAALAFELYLGAKRGAGPQV